MDYLLLVIVNYNTTSYQYATKFSIVPQIEHSLTGFEFIRKHNTKNSKSVLASGDGARLPIKILGL